MTLPQIKSFVAQNDLEFIGFTLSEAILRQYAERFPDNRAMNNLDNWHVFEQENPKTFINMYQFWVQKNPANA